MSNINKRLDKLEQHTRHSNQAGYPECTVVIDGLYHFYGEAITESEFNDRFKGWDGVLIRINPRKEGEDPHAEYLEMVDRVKAEVREKRGSVL